MGGTQAVPKPRKEGKSFLRCRNTECSRYDDLEHPEKERSHRATDTGRVGRGKQKQLMTKRCERREEKPKNDSQRPQRAPQDGGSRMTSLEMQTTHQQ